MKTTAFVLVAGVFLVSIAEGVSPLDAAVQPYRDSTHNQPYVTAANAVMTADTLTAGPTRATLPSSALSFCRQSRPCQVALDVGWSVKEIIWASRPVATPLPPAAHSRSKAS